MTETETMRINDLKINKNNIAANKAGKSTRGISLDNDHKALDGLAKLITQTTRSSEVSNQALKLIFRNQENTVFKSLSPDKGFNIDYILPPLQANKMIELDHTIKDVHVLKRTGVDDFLKRMSKFYEIIIFTASLSKYADPLIDILDKHKVCSIRLFREHCTLFNGLFVKELKRLNRNMKNVILLDNNPASYYLDIENGLPIKSFYDDKSDIELEKMGEVLENLSQVNDVRDYIKEIISLNQVDYERAKKIFEEFKNNKNSHYINKNKHMQNNTSHNENNISVIKTVNLEVNSNDYLNTNNNQNTYGNNFYNNTTMNNVQTSTAHIRNRSSLEADKKFLMSMNNTNNNNSINLTNGTSNNYNGNLNNNNNETHTKNTNNLSNKERLYEKMAEKFNKNQLKILHVEKIGLNSKNQKASGYSSSTTNKNYKSIKAAYSSNTTANLNLNNNSRAKLNQKRLTGDGSKENSLVRNSFLNNSNTTKNSHKSELFKMKNFNNVIYKNKESSSKKNSFLNSERTNEKERENSSKSQRFGFAAAATKNKTSAEFFKTEKKESTKNLNINTNSQNILKISENIKRPASVNNSKNTLFKAANYFSLKNSLNTNSNINNNVTNNQKNISIINNNNSNISNINSKNLNLGQNSISKNYSNKSLLENRIRNNIKNSAANAAAAVSMNETEFKENLNNNNNINSIRVNKDINNNKNEFLKKNNYLNNNMINEKNSQANVDIKHNDIHYNIEESNNENSNKNENQNNLQDDYLNTINKQHLDQIKADDQNYFSNKSNANINLDENENNEKNLPISLEDKKNGKIGINELGNFNRFNYFTTENLNDLNNKNLNNNQVNRGNLSTKNSSNSIINNLNNMYSTNNKKTSKTNAYNNVNNSTSKVRVKKVDNNPRHSFNALDLKKAVLQDPSFNKMNFFSKNFNNGPVSVRNVSNSQKIAKKDLIFNNNNNTNNNNYQKTTGNNNNIINNFLSNTNEVKINLENENKNQNTAGNSTSKNLIKHYSKNTIEKLDDYMKVNNSTTTARNVKNGRIVFDFNNKSNHNNSTSNSKDKYFAMLNKRNPKESSNTFSTSSYSTSSSANRKPFNTITNNLKNQNSLDMKIIKIQSIANNKINSQIRDNNGNPNQWNNGVNRLASAKN